MHLGPRNMMKALDSEEQNVYAYQDALSLRVTAGVAACEG